MVSVIGLGFTKISIILLYRRIFRTSVFQRVCLVYIGVVVAWMISFFFACLFQCTPVTPFVEGFYGEKCVNVLVLYNVVGGSDVALDVFIILLPVYPVFQVNMSFRKQMAVLGMFLLGLLAVACSIARLVSFVQCDTTLIAHYNDETYYTSGVFIWSVIELVMAVVSACLPTLRPLFLRKETSVRYASGYADKHGGYVKNHSLDSTKSDEYAIPALPQVLPAIHAQSDERASINGRFQPADEEHGIYVERRMSWREHDAPTEPRWL